MTDQQTAAVRRVIAEMRDWLTDAESWEPQEHIIEWADKLEAALGEAPAFDEEGIRQHPLDGKWEACRCTLTRWDTRAAAQAWMQRGGEAPASPWQPIETAPKGSWPNGPDDVRDPAYVAPPHLWLVLPDGQRCVGSFDAYYAEGGNGYDGDSPWVEEFSGERVRPTHWMPLPDPPRGSSTS